MFADPSKAVPFIVLGVASVAAVLAAIPKPSTKDFVTKLVTSEFEGPV